MFGFPNSIKSCSSFSYSAPSILFSSPSTEMSLLWCVNLLTSFRRTSRYSFIIGVFSALFCWRCRQSECRKWGYLIVKRMRSRMTLAETWEWKLFVEKERSNLLRPVYFYLFIFSKFHWWHSAQQQLVCSPERKRHSGSDRTGRHFFWSLVFLFRLKLKLRFYSFKIYPKTLESFLKHKTK